MTRKRLLVLVVCILFILSNLNFAFALEPSSDEYLYGWGVNGSGQLGDGTEIDKLTPTISSDSHTWTDICSGSDHSFAIDKNRSLYAWGLNNYGQLGDGTTIDRLIPTLIGESLTWTDISGGDYHTLAIDYDGSLYAWGHNYNGQLGDGTTIDKLIPTLIDDSHIWTVVSAGDRHSLAMDENGNLYAWGYNLYGQLGDGTTIDKLIPTLIDDSHIWTVVSAGSKHALALDEDGNLYAWGDNHHGQLGDGTTIDKLIPTLIDDSHIWTVVSAGSRHSLALDEDRNLYAWGTNYNGQLGDGTTIDKLLPTLIDDSHTWTEVSAGNRHSLAIDKNGTLYAWGANYSGQLGDGTTIDRLIPTLIDDAHIWTDISVGYHHSNGLNMNSNGAPLANIDYYTIDEDTLLSVAAPGVLSNDIYEDTVSVILVNDTLHGTLDLNTDGSFTYTSDSDFYGTDYFTYKANNSMFDSINTTVTIIINPVNDPPVANDDFYTIDEDTIILDYYGILNNDSDIDSYNCYSYLVNDVSYGTIELDIYGRFSYTPNHDFHGTDSFTYILTDGELDSNIATVTITVNPINDSPVANGDDYSVAEDGLLTVASPGVLQNDGDVDGDTLTAILSSNATNGTLVLNSDGSFTYEPNAGFSGMDSFTYTANDGELNSNIATVTITVNEVNTTPVANNDDYSVTEDEILTVVSPGVLDNDSDVDGDILTAVLESNATDGTLILNSDGSFTYEPDTGFSGMDSFTYTANDGELDSNIATVTIAVNDVNIAPVADNDDYSVAENGTLSVSTPGVLTNDSDADGDTLTAILSNGATNGTLDLNSDGSFTYEPDTGFSGIDSFTYTANDGELNSNIATVTITVNEVNTTPVADNDDYSVAEDGTLSVSAPGVLTNDSDADGDTLTAVLTSNAVDGTLVLNSDGSFTYEPDTGFSGIDSFTYTANDGELNSNIATVTITVNEVNIAPVANNDDYSVTEDEILTVVSPGVLDNDSDVDGDILTAVLESNATDGTLILNSDGSFTYEPDTGFSGIDSFTYTANDGELNSNIATVTITINEVNTTPVADNDDYSVEEDGTLSVSAPGVLTNDNDADGDTLTAVLTSNAVDGTLVLNSDGSFSYEPDTGFSGIDSFTYTANDGELDSNVATVTIEVEENTVVYNHLVKRIEIETESGIGEVEIDRFIQMTAVIKPNSADLKTVAWNVEDGTGSAAIDENGLLTGISEGDIIVIATAMDGSGIQGKATILVKEYTAFIPVSEIVVEGENGLTTITRHETLQMTATISPQNASNKTVIWTVSNGDDGGKAKISTTGKLTGLRYGTVTVIATAADGSGTYGSCIITIE